jgi:uncharacterized lipoprotein YbaY
VRVRLLDDGKQADAPARLLAEQTLEKPKAFPVSFSLCYDKQAIQAGGSYSVQAQVYVDGELRLQNTSRINAFVRKRPSCGRADQVSLPPYTKNGCPMAAIFIASSLRPAASAVR